jgi:hypothetical protein
MPQHSIYEFRDYTLRPGQRDVLIDLFEREFVETQEAEGMRVIGTFRDLDRPDRFVWMRSFHDMESRATALNAFYTGPAWQTHRNTANATMIDSDNVLLLHPTLGQAAAPSATRAPVGAPPAPRSLVLAAIYPLPPRTGDAFAAHFERDLMPALRDAGAAPFAAFATDHSANTFPALPVRENDTVFVTLTRFASLEAHAASQSTLNLLSRELPTPEVRRLQPTARSLLQ